MLGPALPTTVSDYEGTEIPQVHGDTEGVVAFAFRDLSAVEHKYSTIENEALGCVWAVERSQTCLWGCKTMLRTNSSGSNHTAHFKG